MVPDTGTTSSESSQDGAGRSVAWEPALGKRNGPSAWLGYGAYRFALGTLTRLPLAWQNAFARGFGRLARRIDKRHTEAGRRFLSQALPELSVERREQLLADSWVHLLEVSLAGYELASLRTVEELRARFELEQDPVLQRVFESPAGAVVVCPHLGNWEAALTGLPFQGFEPLYGIARAPKNRPLARFLQAQRERNGTWILERHGAFRKSVRILRDGGYLAMVPDQRARINPVIVPFFGRPAKCEQAPALLLLRSKVPIVVGFCRPLEGRRFRLELKRIFWPEDWKGSDIETVSGAIFGALEELIRANPELYLWLHDRYYKMPPWPAPAQPDSGPPTGQDSLEPRPGCEPRPEELESAARRPAAEAP